jgi:hypothetical protein
MKSTTSFLSWLLPIIAAASVAMPLPTSAQPGEVEAEAMQLLRRSTDYLAAMKQFRIDTDATIEAVLPGGQKLQYGQRVAITVQRPNRLRAERIGEVVNQTFFYDGKALSVNLPDLKLRSVAHITEEMLDFARDKLQIIAPGPDLICKDAFERLTQGLTPRSWSASPSSAACGAIKSRFATPRSTGKYGSRRAPSRCRGSLS